MLFSFIGGTYRGFKVLETLLENKYFPKEVFILKEDEHETLKYSNDIKTLCDKNKIKCAVKKSLSVDDYKSIKESDLDFILVCGWRTLIDVKTNDFLKFGMIAAHDSLLPKYRGFAPTNWAIINGETETGVTLFKIQNDEVDSGVIINQKAVKIEFEDYAVDILNRITEATIELYLEFINDYSKDRSLIKLTKQNETEATYTCKRSPEDGKIDWKISSIEIYNFIRALAHPFTGAFCFYNNTKYIINKAVIGRNNDKIFVGNIIGKVYKIHDNSIEILCGKGTIEILEWKSEESNKFESPSVLIRSIKSKLE